MRSSASAHIYVDNGKAIKLDQLSRFTTTTKLASELALQVGAERKPPLKAMDVTRFLRLLHDLAEHHQTLESDDKALDYALTYLDAAVLREVRMSDQVERWRAFDELRTDPVSGAFRDGTSIAEHSTVLVDTDSGERLVRCSWFAAFLRQQGGAGIVEEITRALQRLGWRKSGREGKVKATAPGRPATLIWAFWIVDPDWPEGGSR
jgi:hypothetical protein